MYKRQDFENKFGVKLAVATSLGNFDKTIIFLHGLNSCSINHPLLQKIADDLQSKANIILFDFMGTGQSQGDFKNFSIEQSFQDLDDIINQYIPANNKIILFARSLGSATALQYIKKHPKKISKIFFHAPAINLKEIMKYLVAVTMDWHWPPVDRKSFEKKLIEAIMAHEKIGKLTRTLLLENIDQDYQSVLTNDFQEYKNILIAHGDADNQVPFGMNDKLPSQIEIIKVLGGSHELNTPEMVSQYYNKMMDFLTL